MQIAVTRFLIWNSIILFEEMKLKSNISKFQNVNYNFLKDLRGNPKCSELRCIWQYSDSFGLNFGLKLAFMVTWFLQKVRVQRDYDTLISDTN